MNEKHWIGKTILITGHTGFKGSWLSLWLQKLKTNVIGYSKTIPTKPSLFELANVDEGMISIFDDVQNLDMLKNTIKKYEPEEYRPGLDINDDEELVKAGSDYTQTIFHPVGTCKMGQDDMAVVDEKLRVRGIKNLRVIDASIMPNITSGNTNAPTIMIAEKGADMILQN